MDIFQREICDTVNLCHYYVFSGKYEMAKICYSGVISMIKNYLTKSICRNDQNELKNVEIEK